ncbi:MAG: hypothetical protein ABI766_13605 [Gemmatimonadales bacterium]
MDASWTHELMRVRDVVRRAAPGAALDPRVVAELSGVPMGQVIALLQFLARNREGRLELRVVDGRGIEVASFRSLPEVPAVVTDEFGTRIAVEPENVELIFRVSR